MINSIILEGVLLINESRFLPKQVKLLFEAASRRLLQNAYPASEESNLKTIGGGGYRI